MPDRAPHRLLRLGRRGPDRPARGAAAAARRVHHLPRRQPPRALRAAHRRRGAPLQPASASTSWPRATSRRIVVACNTLDAPWRCPSCVVATTCRSWASCGRAPRPPRSPPARAAWASMATPATVRSHAYFQAIKDENPVRRGLRARHARAGAAGRGGPASTAPRCEAAVRRALAPLLRRARRRRRVRLPAAAGGAHRHAAARLHPLSAAGAGHPGCGGARRGGHRLGLGDGVARWPACSRSTAWARRHGSERDPCSSSRPATVRAFRRTAERLFGELFPSRRRRSSSPGAAA